MRRSALSGGRAHRPTSIESQLSFSAKQLASWQPVARSWQDGRTRYQSHAVGGDSGSFEVPVRTRVDRAVVAACVQRFARARGATAREAGEIAIVASELAANAVRHGGGGVVRIVEGDGQVEIECSDRGAGDAGALRSMARDAALKTARSIADPLRDPRGGLGHGLGAAVRLSDAIVFETRAGGGVIVRAWRRLGGASR
jgi:serine/threonine-protein kinase RsbT